MKLLEAAKDVNKFTKFVIEKYDELYRQLESICDQQPPGGDTDLRRNSKTATDRIAFLDFVLPTED